MRFSGRAATSATTSSSASGPRPRRTTRVAASSGTDRRLPVPRRPDRPQGRLLLLARPALSRHSPGGLAWANEVRRRRRRRGTRGFARRRPRRPPRPLYWSVMSSIRRLRLNGLSTSHAAVSHTTSSLMPSSLEGGARCRVGAGRARHAHRRRGRSPGRALKLHGPRQEGDEDLVYLWVRRPVIEWALRRAAAADPSVEIGRAFR